MNDHLDRHVVTIEDPIEFVFRDKRCAITQREIGIDTPDYATALKHVVRQTPDVILLGEMRDKETIESALQAAETGHLVLSTLHTVNAVQTVERIISFFPPHQHQTIRLQLALVLEGVVSQRLITRRAAAGRVPAVEILLGTPTVKEMLLDGRTRDLSKMLDEGHEHYGTQTFNQSLRDPRQRRAHRVRRRALRRRQPRRAHARDARHLEGSPHRRRVGVGRRVLNGWGKSRLRFRCVTSTWEGRTACSLKPFIGTLRVTNPVR